MATCLPGAGGQGVPPVGLVVRMALPEELRAVENPLLLVLGMA